MRLIDADDLIERFDLIEKSPAALRGIGLKPIMAIEDIKTVIQAAPTLDAMKWISVDDRLPTFAELHQEEVLALFEDGTMASVHYDENIDGDSIFGYWQQLFDPQTLGATESEWRKITGITHWMPLPKPPEAEHV